MVRRYEIFQLFEIAQGDTPYSIAIASTNLSISASVVK